MKGTVISFSWCGPSVTVVTRGCRNDRTRARQYSRSHAYVHSSFHVSVAGASISMSPVCGAWYISKMACFTMRSRPIRNMCPSHWSFLARIHFTKSNVLPLVASSLTVLPVITLTMLELAPFRAARTSVVSRHASEPYVRILQTLDLYNLIRRFTCRVLLPHMFLILPKRCLKPRFLVAPLDLWQ